MFEHTCNFLVVSKESSEATKMKRILKDILEDDFGYSVAQNMGDALKVLADQFVDLIFLDINIGRKEGFEFINHIPPSCRPTIVFIADESSVDPELINYGVMYYLWRPLKKESVHEALTRFLHNIHKKRKEKELMYLMNHAVSFSGEHSRIALPYRTEMELISLHQIVRCESESNYTHIYTLSGTKYTLPKTLKEVEKGLGSFFFRIHRSHIVNLNMVRKINGKELLVEMMNGFMLPVSEDRKTILMGKVKISLNQKNGA